MIFEGEEARIMGHLKRYRLSHAAAASSRAESDEECSSSLARLQARRLVKTQPLPGRMNALTLSRAGVSALSLPPKRAQASSNIKAINDTLATTWYCCLGDAPRFRLEFTEMRELIGAEPPKGPVFALDPAESAIKRIYVAGDTADALVLRQVNRWLKKTRKHEALAPALESGELGITCLVAEPERVDDLAAKLRDAIPSVRSSVDFAPGLERLSDALKQREAS